MEVILLDRIRNLGNLGDKVNVRPGYGRNFLIPQGKAIPATGENLHVFEERRAELEQKAAESLTLAKEKAEKLADLNIVITARAADEGKLYGSVGTAEIAHAISQGVLEIEKSEINLPTGVIREVGEYDIDVNLHSDVTITIKVTVEAEDKV